jgi:hypothetical protein
VWLAGVVELAVVPAPQYAHLLQVPMRLQP